MKGYIHSFESFGTVDGPGIRFIVFMQGCPLRCLYCHNPDTWKTNINKQYEAIEVKNEIIKYKRYFTNGGVTISGGEPLMQIDFVIELLKLLKKEKIHVAIDTSGITFTEKTKPKFDELIKYVDLFLLDIKHIDDLKHQDLTKVSNVNILNFARYLSDNKKDVWIRHVLVPNYTTDTKYLKQLRSFIETLNNVKKIEVLPYHTMGIVKYQQMNIEYPLKNVEAPSKDIVEKANNILKGVENECEKV